jgi:hypothetical protein
MVPTTRSASTSPVGRPDQGMDRVKGGRWAADGTAEGVSASGGILGDLSGAIPAIAAGHAGNRLTGGAPARG